MDDIGSVAARITGTSRPASPPRSAWSTARANWRCLVFWPSEPWSRKLGDRSAIDALPAALAASVGRSGTSTVNGAPSRVTSTRRTAPADSARRSEEHTSELQSRQYLVCRLLLEKKKDIYYSTLQ